MDGSFISKHTRFLCLLLVIASILPIDSVVAQNRDVSASNWYDLCKEINEKGATPVKASLASTIESPVNTLTGALSFDIPIYTIELGSYSLPISLHYETSGFKPTDIASNVGLGWSINGIGCIARTIKGFRDEYNPSGYNNHDLGYVSNLCFTADEDVTREQFVALDHLANGNYDAEPDLYSFNFAGHSGSFINRFENFEKIINFNDQNIIINNGNGDYAFSITDETGNIYYFGGGNSNEHIISYNNTQICMEETYWNTFYSFQNRFACGNDGCYFEGDKDYDVKWYLSKIEIASSDYEIDFEYEHDNARIYIGTDETYMYGHPFLSPGSLTPKTTIDSIGLRFNRFKYAQMPRITKITWKKGDSELGSIVFVRDDNYRCDLQNHSSNPGLYAIKKIKVMNSDDSVNYYMWLKHSYNNGLEQLQGDSGQLYKSSFYYKLFLDKIFFLDKDDNDLYSYEFSYNLKDRVIARNSPNLDMWGYAKAQSLMNNPTTECSLIKPKLFYYENGDENPLYRSVYSVWERYGEQPTYILDGNDMTPNPTWAAMHTLVSVTTPCGGVVSFEYEPNDFYFDNQMITGPGVRVKSVTYNSNGTTNTDGWTRTYSYTDDSGITSGRVTSIPDYGYFNATAYVNRWNISNGNSQGEEYDRNVFTARQFSTVSDMTGTSQSMARYSKTTVSIDNMGKTEYYYQLGWNAGEDSIHIGGNEYVHRTKTHRAGYVQIYEVDTTNPTTQYYGDIPHNDGFPKFTQPITSWCGDFLTKELNYDLNNKVVESKEYKYSLHPSSYFFLYMQAKYFIRFSVLWYILDGDGNIADEFYNFQLDILWGWNKYRTGSRRLDTIIQTRYSGETSNRTVKTFDYYNVGNVVNVVKSETVTNSDGNTVCNNYTYPFNYNHSVSPLGSMTEQNMLMTPVEQYTSVNDKVTDGAFIKYSQHGDFIKPDKAFRLRAKQPLSDFSPSNPSGKQDGRYDEVVSLTWDDTHANIIETKEEGDVLTTYIWGYHNSLLIAKIENATYTEVTGQCSPEQLQDKTNDELVEAFQQLREALPNAMVTSYTYDAARNLLSVTNPAGKTATYEYDSASRLKITRDVENNIINKYDYHYGSSKN